MSTITEVRPAPPPARAALAPLARQLTAADRVLQQEKGASLVLRAWPWVFGYLLAAFALDVLLHFAAGPRVALLAGFGLLVIAVLVAGAYLAWVRRNSFEHTARVLESRDSRLGSKLINVLQLQAQTEDRAVSPLTRELAGMAIAGYTDELRGENLPRLARTDRLKCDARRLAYGAGGFLAILAAFFSITRTELPRFLDPFGDHPPYSFTRLEITEPGNDSSAVVYGQSIVITAQSHGHRPGELFLTHFAPENPAARTTVPMFDKGDRGFTQQIEGIKTNLVVFAHTRNGHSLSKQRRIAVILTPKLERASVRIAPPAYTGLAPDERTLQFKSLKALEGSTLTFRLASNRPLASGRISVANESGAIQPVTMEASGESEVVASIVARESAQLNFSITDRDGFDSQETWPLALSVTHDLPPDVQITNPNSDSFVAMDFKVEPVIEAADDYGLKTVRIHQARNGVFVEPRTIDYDKPPLNAREGLTFDFRNMDVASGDEISIFAEAIDNAPEPHLVRTKTLTLTVISTEEYNQFLRERMDLGDIEAKYAKLLNEFHDLVDQQKKLGEEIDALKKQLEVAQTDAEKAALQQKLDELLAKQQQLNQQLNQLANTMENFVRDQPLYDIEADLKNTLAEKAQEIRDSTKANDEKVKELAAQLPQPAAPQPPGADGATPPSKNPAAGNAQAGLSQKMLNDFKQASDEQLEKLGAVEKEAQEQVMQPLEDLSLMHEIVKDINRFKELYEAQKQLAEQARAYDRPGPLSREDQLALKNMAALENEIGAQLDAVEQKLWEDGKAAEGKFPKAGHSAQHLAQQMGDLRLQSLAHKATGAMLEGKGDQGAQLAENLRSEMDKLFCQCNSKGGEMSNELDQYMSIQRSMKPANNFKQMMQTRKFGSGSKFGPMGSGKGAGGKDGYAVITGPNANVMGGEAPITESDKAKTDGPGRNKAKPDAASAAASIDKEDVVHGVEPINRESGAVQGEAGIEQYREIVDKYFKAITKPGGAQGAVEKAMSTSAVGMNTQHPTPNAQHPMPLAHVREGHWMLDVGCWVLGVFLSAGLSGHALAAGAGVASEKKQKEMEEAVVKSADSPNADLTKLQCGNLVYAGNKSSICFADKFLGDVARQTNLNVGKNFVAVKLEADNVFDFPFCVWSGEQDFSLTKKERENLRKYLLNGGFILSSPGCSDPAWDVALRKELKLIFPEYKMVKLPMSHPAFSTVNRITRLTDKKGAQAFIEGMEVNGRLVMVYSKDGLNDVANAKGCCCCGGNMIVEAVLVNVNVFTYALLY